MWNHWKLFEKVTKEQNVDLFWVPNGTKIGSLRSLQRTYKAGLTWTQRKYFDKIVENLNFDPFGDLKWPKNLGLWAYLLHTYKSSSNELINQVSSESSGNFSRKLTKTYKLTYFEKGPKFGPQGSFFTYTWKYRQYAWNQVSWSRIKTFREHVQKHPKFSFLPFFVIKDPL